MSGINTIVADHFEMLIGDMFYKAFTEIKCRDGFVDQGIILMPAVMEGDQTTIIFINTFGGDDRAAEITPDVFCNNRGITMLVFRKDIESLFVFKVHGSFYLFKRGTDPGLHLIQEGGHKSISEESETEALFLSPKKIITKAALSNKAMDMRVPFKIPAESMEDTDEAGGKEEGFIIFMKEAEDNGLNSRKKAVEKGTVFKEKSSEGLGNGEDTVAVGDIDHFERHGHCPVHGISVTAGWTESGMAAKRDKFEQTTLRTAIHGTAIRSITAMNHFFNGFHNDRAGMEDILDFFIMIAKDFL